MKKRKTGKLAAGAVFAFIFFIAAVATCILSFDKYDSLSSEIKRILAIPEAKAEPGEEWLNPNTDIAYTPIEKMTGQYLHYYAYDNIEFISYSEKWDEKKLEALKDELLSNVHGQELDYLDQIIIYAEEDPDALGYQSDDMRFYPVEIFSPGLLPQNLEYNFSGMSSTIEITGGDTYTEVYELARTLSHEYGHHFTGYYFFNDYADLSESEYYKTRNNPMHEIFYEWGDTDHYYDNHMWYLWELAADDYVYFFGSPGTRYTEDYLDDLELLKLDVKSSSKKDDYYNSLTYDSFNLTPHLNTELPMPDMVPGLKELFEGCLDVDIPQNPYDASGIAIDINREYQDGYSYYKITWNKPWIKDNVFYTLVAYDENGDVYQGVKTISGSEEALAYLGQVVYSDYYLEVDLPDKLSFRVVVTFAEGFAAVSPAVDWEF